MSILRRSFWMSKATSRESSHCLRRKDSTKLKSRVAPNSSVESRTFGARMSHGTIRKIRSRLCEASTASNFSTTANVGGSCRSIGSTNRSNIRFRKSIFSGDFFSRSDVSGRSSVAVADARRGNILSRDPAKARRLQKQSRVFLPE